MHIRIHGDLLITADVNGLRSHLIREDGSLASLAERAEPSQDSHQNPSESGEWVTEVVSDGIFARAFLVPGSDARQWAHTWIGLYDLDLNELARWGAGRRLDSRSLALSPDGKLLASVNYGDGVAIFYARTGELHSQYEGELGSGVSWSPTGRYLTAGDTGQGGGVFYLLDSEEDFERSHLPAPSARSPLYDSPFQATFSPDESLVAFSNAAWGVRGVAVYDIETFAERWSMRFPFSNQDDEDDLWQALDLHFVHHGDILLAGLDGGVRAWRAASGEELTTLECPDASSMSFGVEEARRRIWFSRQGELVCEGWPEDWRA